MNVDVSDVYLCDWKLVNESYNSWIVGQSYLALNTMKTDLR